MKFLGRVFLVILVLLSYAYVYSVGVDDGYWEHEGEENVYACEVI